MKKVNQTISPHFIFLPAIWLLATAYGFGQAPNGFNYQTVLRDGSGGFLSHANATIELEILLGGISGSVVYSEIHSVTSNASGQVNLEIGAKDPAGFSSIDWANGPYFIKIAVNGTVMGAYPLVSVPYALYANSGAGSPGPKGDIGPQGPNGDKGDTGPQGPKGDKGDKGSAGPQGPKGDKGDTGSQGSKGDAGLQGPKGDAGPQGLKGEKGDTGLQGPKGDKGDTGAQGPKGDKGDTGLQGLQGDKGDTGLQGLQGDKGNTGPTGPIGDTGPTGPASPVKCIAFGCISSDGSIFSGSGNFTCTWDASYNRYNISISDVDYFYTNYTTLVTVVSPPVMINSPGVDIYTTSFGGDLLVYMSNYMGDIHQFTFHFIVFKNEPIYYSISDIDGNTYKTVQIGTQTWMAENLRTTIFNDGTAIPLVTDFATWAGLITPAYCWYNNDEAAYMATYGALYNWYTVDIASNGNKNVCPSGWHVPKDDEWTILADYLCGITVAGGKLKETGTTHWASPNAGATNETGFAALPGGYRYFDGAFYDIGYHGYWWSASEIQYGTAWDRFLSYYYSSLIRSYGNKQVGFSVRCVRD